MKLALSITKVKNHLKDVEASKFTSGEKSLEINIIIKIVRLFPGAIGPDFIFMEDNARSHRTLPVEELLESEDITRMDWPAYSPDLNLIDLGWHDLGRRIAARLHHPENTQQLKQMLIEEWALLLGKKYCISWF
ncbi:transposable element Tcb2 transposase [Trichonephila clavipes]|nr:transposable element Tcb2 transposase [Trichonephila clavipes]